jgi:plasmid maintenance system antidote protein VapI
MTMKPPHPGETIKEEYLVRLGMSVSALARELGIGAAASTKSFLAVAA